MDQPAPERKYTNLFAKNPAPADAPVKSEIGKSPYLSSSEYDEEASSESDNI